MGSPHLQRMPHLSPGLLRALPLVLVCIVIIHSRLPDPWTAANCSMTATLPPTMLRYLPNQILELNTRLAPSNIFALKQLGILRRPRYVHRGSRRRFVYSESISESSIPSLCTAASGAHQRRHRMRHQSAHGLGLKNHNRPHQGPLLEEPRTARPGKRGVDHSVLRSLSGFRCAHSTETALVRVTNDLLVAADQGSPSLLLLLDHSAAFDTVDHAILLHRLQHFIGISHTALQWFQSYLTNRVEYVALGGARLDPTSPASSLHTLTACLEETKSWMTDNFLQLNSFKTEGLLIGTPHQLRSSTLTVYSFAGHDISLTSSITNLGVRFDPHLSFNTHIQLICKTAFFHLRNISKLRPSLSLSDSEKLVHAFVSSRLDYCNALLIGIPGSSLQRLQYIQNCAARVLMRVRKSEHITPILHKLHWLPVRFRIEYKICLLTYQCVYGSAPVYLKDLINRQNPTRHLRSSDSHQLQVPKSKLRTMGDRAFQVAAPRLWNTLPNHLRAPQSIEDT
ncbi:unnamed protein product [Leuciscus chuanchicus]